MAGEKKPKIDLKARLGKSTAQTPPPGTVMPTGAPGAAGRGPVPIPSPSVPGVPVGPPPFAPSSQPSAIDPNNPLSAVAAPYRAPAPPQPHSTRIEVDELAVQTASKSARKQGIVVGVVLAVIMGGVGYVAGNAAEQAAGRTKSRGDAAELKGSVGKARVALKTIADKMEAGSRALLADRKFPDTLAKDLGGVNVDFDGTQLAGRRFSGFPQETTHDLVEFITGVQAVNDRKDLVIGLLTRLQKPITEQLNAPPGQQKVSYVVAVDKDPSGNLAGFLSPLATPITVTAQNIALPPRFVFTVPGGGGNTDLPRYTGGDIAAKPAALYVVPKSFETVCPTATSGQVSQLGAQIGGFLRDVRGEQQGDPTQDAVQDSKPGLLQRADKLIDELNKI
jgi:hypothetical protein